MAVSKIAFFLKRRLNYASCQSLYVHMHCMEGGREKRKMKRGVFSSCVMKKGGEGEGEGGAGVPLPSTPLIDGGGDAISLFYFHLLRVLSSWQEKEGKTLKKEIHIHAGLSSFLSFAVEICICAFLSRQG